MLKKNSTIAGVLAFFLGTVGIHQFYMGNVKKGLIYLLLFWTGIPTILGIMDGAVYLTEDGDGETESIDIKLEETESDVAETESVANEAAD